MLSKHSCRVPCRVPPNPKKRCAATKQKDVPMQIRALDFWMRTVGRATWANFRSCTHPQFACSARDRITQDEQNSKQNCDRAAGSPAPIQKPLAAKRPTLETEWPHPSRTSARFHGLVVKGDVSMLGSTLPGTSLRLRN